MISLHALDHEHPRLRRFCANFINLLLFGRIVPSLCLLRVVEGNDDRSLRRGPLEGSYIGAAGDVATALHHCRRTGGRSLSDGFEPFRISYVVNVNDNNSGGLAWA